MAKAIVFDYGRGGAHRKGCQHAATWRTMTAVAAKSIRETHPRMSADAVLEHAKLEVGSAMRQYNNLQAKDLAKLDPRKPQWWTE